MKNEIPTLSATARASLHRKVLSVLPSSKAKRGSDSPTVVGAVLNIRGDDDFWVEHIWDAMNRLTKSGRVECNAIKDDNMLAVERYYYKRTAKADEENPTMSKAKTETRGRKSAKINIATGTRIVMTYQKKRHVIEVTANGFKYSGSNYDAPGEVGEAIRGTTASAKFFGIIAGKFNKAAMGSRIIVVKPGDKLPSATAPAATKSKPKAKAKSTPKTKSTPKKKAKSKSAFAKHIGGKKKATTSEPRSKAKGNKRAHNIVKNIGR